MAEYDRSSKWLIQHHGDALLRLEGIGAVTAWRALQAELVQPGQLPDGLIEAQLPGRSEPDLYVVEIATYPEQRLYKQLLRDTALVYLDRQVLPEVLAVILHPKGTLRVANDFRVRSPQGWSEWTMNWRVVELWTLPAEELLAAGDPGLVPWVPLTRFDGPPEPVFQECRRIIDQETDAEERGSLLAVTQILAKLRYNDPQLLTILGGREAMIESPLLQELAAEMKQEDILIILSERFGAVSHETEAAIKETSDVETLQEMLRLAARCPDLAAFRAQLPS
jgi:hypothetical protein